MEGVVMNISLLSEQHIGIVTNIRARLQTSRVVSATKCFLILRQQFSTIQGVVSVDDKIITKEMLKSIKGISDESLINVQATVVKALQPVSSCSIKNVELKILNVQVVSEASRLPFTLEDASRSLEQLDLDPSLSKVSLSTRLDNRIVDLRTLTNKAIFKMQHGITRLFREFLEHNGFIEIHTPKLIGTASEGGAEVFKLSYFSHTAYLAQSPQLYKQMTICSDFERVFEIAPVFRAENCSSHRHMTEFTSLDVEMVFKNHYHEVLDLLDRLLVHIFNGLRSQCFHEIQFIKKQFPFQEITFLPKTLRLEYPEAINMLRKAGIQIQDLDDLNTESERALGRLVKEKYDTDFFMLDKFPLSIRPFYTMPDPKLPDYSHSYDFFLRGEEILSGAQRVHDPTLLEARAMTHQINLDTIRDYLNAFKYGVPPHAGGGIGLERLLMLYLNLGNIRKTSLFPRDPKRLTP